VNTGAVECGAAGGTLSVIVRLFAGFAPLTTTARLKLTTVGFAPEDAYPPVAVTCKLVEAAAAGAAVMSVTAGTVQATAAAPFTMVRRLGWPVCDTRSSSVFSLFGSSEISRVFPKVELDPTRS